MRGFTLHKIGFHTVSVKNESDDAVGIFALFLISDVRNDAKSWKRIILDPNFEAIGGNITVLMREENGDILMRDMFAVKQHDPYFLLTQIEFCNALDQWDELYKKQPDKIIVTIDDEGKVTMEGITYDA